MSFILDALKKSEQKRRRGSVPDLLTRHEPVTQEAKKRSLWPYLLFIALLFNAGVFLVWLPWSLDKSEISVRSISSQPDELKSIDSGKASDTYLQVQVKSSNMAKTVNPGAKVTEEKKSSELDTTAVAVINTASVVPQNQMVQTKVRGEGKTVPSSNIGVASGQGVPNFTELPLTVQQDLSDLSITGHIFSNDPTSRIININSKLVREGETVSAGLKLEEISPAGAIFSYRGYRFQIRRF